MKLFSLSLLTLVAPMFIAPAHASKAHEHGVAKVDIAFDGTNGVIDFESPAANIYGFEHKAKSAKDKKVVDEKVEILKTKISEMVIFDKKGECTITVKEIEPFENESDDHDHHHEPKGKPAKGKKAHKAVHSEVHAEYTVTCKNSLAGTPLNFGFTKFFPALKKLKVQVLNGEKQNGATIQSDKGKIDL